MFRIFLFATLTSSCMCNYGFPLYHQIQHQQSQYQSQQGQQQQQQQQQQYQNQVPVTADIEDFHEAERGAEIIFHDTHDLLFVINGANCYFVPTPDDKESELEAGPKRQYTEMDLVTSINYNSHDMVKASSLDEVRAEFQDVLADYHCKGRNIFYVDYFGVKMPPPTTPPQTTPPAATSASTCVRADVLGRNVREGLRRYCRGKTGLFPFPGNCRKFVTCVNNMAYPANCADGTSFDYAHRLGCSIVGTRNNPCC